MIKLNTKKILNSVPVTCSATVLNWMVQEQMKAYKAGHKSLLADIREQMTKAFGEPNTTKTFEFRTKIWIIEFKSLTFNVFSAAKKGTSIEICNCTYDDMYNNTHIKEIIEFLELLSNKINTPTK